LVPFERKLCSTRRRRNENVFRSLQRTRLRLCSVASRRNCETEKGKTRRATTEKKVEAGWLVGWLEAETAFRPAGGQTDGLSLSLSPRQRQPANRLPCSLGRTVISRITIRLEQLETNNLILTLDKQMSSQILYVI
jgi:hypothetical protein